MSGARRWVPSGHDVEKASKVLAESWFLNRLVISNIYV